MNSRTKSIVDILKGPIEQEKRLGYTDKSVVGGFGVFVERQLVSGDDGLVDKFKGYSFLGVEERKALVAELEAAYLEGHGSRVTSHGPTNKGHATRDTRYATDLRLDTPLKQLKDISRSQKMALSRLGIKCAADLLAYYPRWPLHRDWLTPIGEARGGEAVMLGKINGWDVKRKGRLLIIQANVEDDTGRFSWTWFNQPYIKAELRNDRWLVVRGRIEKTPFGLQLGGRSGNHVFLENDEVEKLKKGELVLRYHTTRTLGQSFLKRAIGELLSACAGELVNVLPDPLAAGLPGRQQALKDIHGATRPGCWEKARRSLALEELFYLQVYLGLRSRALGARDKKRKYQLTGEKGRAYLSGLPFSLTASQERCLGEIRDDLKRQGPMNRLLQGDVGSGKTVLAAAALLAAVDSGYQAVIMAPTEILAEQHYRTMSADMEKLGVKPLLLTSGMTAKGRREAYAALSDGSCRLAVGTHALFQQEVKFKELGLVVVDERHKFGVEQRARLEAKGDYPDCLMMTATPLPRAIVLTLYGDTDISVLDEMPPGRGELKTEWVPAGKRARVYGVLRERLDAGEQGYIVFPLVEESDKLNIKAATAMFDELTQGELAGYKIGLIHGRMKGIEKERIMSAFRAGELQALVSTTVIEVGIDVATATVLVIENAERFGLSQLHQLRGRVGRGKAKSYCYLLGAWGMTSEAKERLRAMTKYADGFRLAEEDLRLRGPGELFGTRQSGYSPSMVVDLKRDGELVERARREVTRMLAGDPKLGCEENCLFREELKRRFKDEMEMVTLS